MKIGYITYSVYPVVVGGSEISVFYLAKELAKRGHDVTVMSFDGDKKEKITEEADGVIFEKYPREAVSSLKKLAFLFANTKFDKFDIIHHYGLMLLLQSYKIKLLNDVKIVSTLNYYTTVCPRNEAMNNGQVCNSCSHIDMFKCAINTGSLLDLFLSLLYRQFSFIIDRYIVLSNNSKRIFVMFGFPEEKIKVIPNFIYPENLPHTFKEDALIYTGQLKECKGLDILIKSLTLVKKEIIDFKCYIIGDGVHKNKLKKIAANLGLSDVVAFTGFLAHHKLREYYLKSKIFVFPVKWPEPFGRSLIEAMNFGLPIIASENIDTEIISNAGLIYRNNDPDELAEKIVFLFKNEKERKALSENARLKVKDYYPERVVPKVEALYKSILNEK